MGWLARQRAKYRKRYPTDKDGLHDGGTTGSETLDTIGRLLWFDPYRTWDENVDESRQRVGYWLDEFKDGFQWSDIPAGARTFYERELKAPPKDQTMKPSKAKAVRSGPRFTLKKKNPMGYAGKKTDPGYMSPAAEMGPGRAADSILSDRFGSSSVLGSGSGGMSYDDDDQAQLVAGVPNLVTYSAGAALAYFAFKRFF